MESQELESYNLQSRCENEINELNKKWKINFDDFIEKAKSIELKMIERHKNEVQEYINHLELKLPRKTKYSTEYLNTKQSQKILIKQEKFIDAHRLKLKCDELERNENEKYIKERNDKIKVKVDILVNKHNLERKGLKQKLDTQYNMMEKMKDHEINQVYVKFKNRKAGLDSQHKQEEYLKNNDNMERASNFNIY